MKKITKRVIYLSLISFVCVIMLATIMFAGIYFFSPRAKFDMDKIRHSNTYIEIYDNTNRLVKDENYGQNFIKLNTLPNYVSQSFIAIEDKDFYNHSGINVKRMVKAMLTNIKSMKIKEGASTISQQLIKNTHLSNERTFSRKFNEISLTKQLEKQMSKNEILEYYLNIIYYGDNCYGIENASNHYFSKSASNLSIDESAILAGLIKSPNIYSPTKNPEKCKSRRNLVLNQMLSCDFITFEQYNKACLKPITLNLKQSEKNTLNTYYQACIDEAAQILKMPTKQISIAEYKIYTYLNLQKQQALENSLKYYPTNTDAAAISINSHNGQIEAYIAKSNVKLINAKRQPGSALKPILVYAPAINENIISPCTQLNDEKIEINGYAPRNVSNRYYGYVSAKDALSKSLNIPAVKVLSYVGLENAKNYAEKCNITFDAKDNNLSIALGGMTYGVSLKQLANSYVALSNKGNFVKAAFVSYIEDKNGKIVYKNTYNEQKVFRDDTSYLITDMLKQCAKTGTARKLGDLNFEIAAKTGTVGKSQNLDAYSMCYTTSDVVGVWLGNADNSPIGNIVGGGIPTDIAKTYLKQIYQNNKPTNFKRPSSVTEEKIDLISLNSEHIVYRANSFIPEKYTGVELFSKFKLPKDKSTKFISVSPVVLDGKIENGMAVLNFTAEDYLFYELYKEENGKTTLLAIISGKSGEYKQQFDLAKNVKTKYFVVTKIKNFADNSEIISDESNIVELLYSNNNSVVKGKSQDKKWYI